MSEAELKKLNDELEALIKENEKILSQLRALKTHVSRPGKNQKNRRRNRSN